MLNAVIPSWMSPYGTENDDNDKDKEKDNDKDKNKGNDKDNDEEEKKKEKKEEPPEPEPYFVANISEFNNTDRKTVHVPEIDKNGKENERPLILIKANNNFYALDLRCYHAGGPLSMGDIEDIEGNLCIKCPWHRYIIKLESGEGLYYGYDPIKKKKTGLTSKGKKQRKHKVIVNQNTNKIYIVLNNEEREYSSDQYAKKLNDEDEGPKNISFKIGGKSKGPAVESGKHKLDKI